MKGKEGKWIQKRAGNGIQMDQISDVQPSTDLPPHLSKAGPRSALPMDSTCRTSCSSSHPCFFPEYLNLERLHELSEEGSADMAAASIPEHLSSPQMAPGLGSL